MIRMREMFVLATGTFCKDPWTSFLNGEFIVSRKRILAQPLQLYEFILKQTEDEVTWKQHDEDALGSTVPDEWFAHVMERIWNPLFGCVEMTAKECCAVGSSEVCTTGSCQCTDSM